MVMMLSLKIIGSQTIQLKMAIKEKELDHSYLEVEQKNKSN